MLTVRQLYPHVFIYDDAMRDLWHCSCGRELTSEFLYQVLIR